MRSLLKAFLLAPAIVSAFVLPPTSEQDVDIESEKNNVDTTEAYTMGFVRLDLGHDSSSADVSPLDLRVDILHSTEACGFGNVLIDGQPLSQTFDSETSISSGKGSISTSTNKIVVGSWSFDCIVIDGKPRGQIMKFMIDFVDGKAIENSGFSVLFRQTGETEIMNIETISSEEDQVIEHHSSSNKQHHNGKGLEGEHKHHMDKGFEEKHKHHMGEGPEGEHKHPMGNGPEGEHKHHMGHKEFDIHKELAELRYMKAQMKELKYLIHKKKHHISKHAREHHNLDDRIRDCDSLRCVAGVISEKARKFYGRIAGDEFDEESFHHSRESRSKKDKKHGKGFHGKPGNHTSGNHTSPQVPHGKNNHTDPHFPPHRHHILPICHYPPPFDFHPHGPHHDGPHGPPHEPPHGPPPHKFGPHGFEHGRHHEMHPFNDDEEEHGPWEGRPRHHGEHHGDDSEELDRPHRGHNKFEDEFEGPHGKHTKPHHEQGSPPFEGSDFDNPEEHPHEGPFDGPEHDGSHHSHEELFEGPKHEGPHHPHNEEPHHSPPHSGPHADQEPPFDTPLPHSSPFHPGPPSSPPPPPPHSNPEHFDSPPHLLEDDFSGPPPHGPPHFPLHILKFILIGFLLSLLLITLHRRTRHPKSHSAPPPHLNPRRRRATFRTYWNRILGQEEDFEEKDRLLSASTSDSNYESENENENENEDENTLSEFSISRDISSFRNAADIVSDMVTAEEGRIFSSTPAPAHCISIPIPVPVSASAHAHQRNVSEDQIRRFDGYTHGVGMEMGMGMGMHDEEDDDEVLPAYEDNDGSEESGSVADGFRYTPGSSAYSPSHSASGSVSDVLGDKV
ncbi:uncharacterized protein EAE98_012288 [Botrytis deweyae]|uniref:Uncharacterized protein n=1 Tax=Botrytis deweyae TaxID=2478750 RepID=A0ABQ7I3N6_9HELO|nr:uncharacterized protein EAE98_012288 [Botrytis deweyae]KAF7909209.1 hypothetical protein EAE98_012288 [Botrytis deweyae]